MANTQPYTNEMTYRITHSDCSALRERLGALQSERTAACHIHTLSFASYTHRTLPGHDGQPAERYCLQYYQNDPTYIFLQRHGSQALDTAMVTEEECRALLAGETDWLLNRRNPLLRGFHWELSEGMLLPRILLSYDQEVYTLPQPEVRFTLDTNIRASMQHMDFLDPQQLERDMWEQEGKTLLRVSCAGTVPDDILCMLREAAPRRRYFTTPYLPA